MNKLLYLMAISAILLSLTGCQEKIGGGSRSIVTGSSTKESVYGTLAGKKLGFVIFTDIIGGFPNVESSGAESRSTPMRSSWAGYIKPKEGPEVQYEGDLDGITINGIEHKFTDGRIFLAETEGTRVSVQQLNIPISDAIYDAEIDRIVELESLQEFLSK